MSVGNRGRFAQNISTFSIYSDLRLEIMKEIEFGWKFGLYCWNVCRNRGQIAVTRVRGM